MMAAYRLMRAFRRAEMPLAAKVASRAIRHLYGADVHWDAAFEPGVVLVHGIGLVVSGEARVGRGAVLFQHVTLGLGRDPDTGHTGAPIVGRNVHIGPGATVVGPLVIGANSKLMPGAVLMRSVPPRSLVRSAPHKVQPRRRNPAPPTSPDVLEPKHVQ
jgi:serine O-acetyltransferase